MSASPIPLVRLAIDQPNVEANRAKKVGIFLRRIVARYLRADWFRCLLLALIGFVVRSPALQGQRIWDDQYLSHDNPFIRSPLLILETFRHYLFLDSFSAHYRPLQNISFVIDYFFWNSDEFGFHLTNMLLHVGSGILLYFLLRQLIASLCLRRVAPAVRDRAAGRISWISHSAFLIALIWVVHPVHSAAVDYISGRADSLAFFFATAGWLLFSRATRPARPFARVFFYFLAAIAGLLALLSREIAVVWVVLFVASLFFVERQIPFRIRIGALLCCLSLVTIYIGLRQLPGERSTSPPQAGWTASVRAMLMARSLGDYGRLMVFPGNLHMERTVFNPAAYRSNVDWRQTVGVEYLSITGLLVLAALVCGSARRGPGQPMRIFGASWFLAAYLPISNIVLLNATVAEHWLYLPSVGFLIFMAGCALELPQRHWKGAVVVAIFVVAGLSARSFMRSTDWVTAEAFYRRTLAAGGTSTRTGVNLGQICAARGAYAEAEKIFRNVLAIDPAYPVAQNSLADVLNREGKVTEAERIFASMDKASAKTRKEYPRTWIGAVNHARMRSKAKDNENALAIIEKARADYPQIWEVISFESEVIRETQGPDAALKLVEDFAHDNWWHYGATLALGRLYAQKGDLGRAETALRHASWLDVHDAEALRLIVMIRIRQNRLDDAFETQQRAVARQPDEPSQYILLSNILEKMGRGAEAHAALAQASRLRALAENQTVAN